MKTVNKVKKTYTFYLEKNIRKINKVASFGNRESLVCLINEVVSPAMETYVHKNKVLPTKKVKFLTYINNSRSTVDSIMKFINQSINKARHTKAKYN